LPDHWFNPHCSLLIPADLFENDAAARFMQCDATKCNEMHHFRAFPDVASFN